MSELPVIYPHPECMAPDGADPCSGYHAAIERIAELDAECQGWAEINIKIQEERDQLRADNRLLRAALEREFGLTADDLAALSKEVGDE